VIEATVRDWHDVDGWGVLDSAETPGGCWVHYSDIDADGFRSLSEVETVLLEYEQAEQDGYHFRAVRVVVPGRAPGTAPSDPPSAAYRSDLEIHLES
jgi:CspA family cold shock protein